LKKAKVDDTTSLSSRKIRVPKIGKIKFSEPILKEPTRLDNFKAAFVDHETRDSILSYSILKVSKWPLHEPEHRLITLR
jgi:hypothetical protein